MPTPPAPSKAYIELLEPSTEGKGGGRIGRVSFQFNPKEYQIQKSASWETKPARGAQKTAMPEFKGAEPRSMTIECFLDAGEDNKDIVAEIEKLLRCCGPLKTSVTKNTPSPPFVRFCWGSTLEFKAFVKQVSVKYSLFTPEGKPIRATASVTLQEVPDDKDKQNPTSGALAHYSSRTLVAGDSLQSLAYRELGSPNLWRALAATNGIDDPLRMRPGTRLLIPPPEDATALA